LLDCLRYLFATSLASLDFPSAYRTAPLPIPWLSRCGYRDRDSRSVMPVSSSATSNNGW